MSEQPIPGLGAEANVFARSKDGFGVHIKLLCENASKIVGNLDTLTGALLAKGYTPESRPGPQEPASRPNGNGGGNGQGGSSKRGGKPAGRYTGEVYTECPWCQSDVYDNRSKKANEPGWRGPWFKCKAGDDCGFVVFKNDGTTGD